MLRPMEEMDESSVAARFTRPPASTLESFSISDWTLFVISFPKPVKFTAVIPEPPTPTVNPMMRALESVVSATSASVAVIS